MPSIVSAADAATVNPKHEQKIKNEAIRRLYTQSKVVLIATLFNSLFLVFFLWQVIDQTILITWIAILFAITIIRTVLSYRYFKAPAQESEKLYWVTFYMVGSLFGGMAWGASGIFLYAPGQVEYQAMLFFLLGGMGAGALISYTCYLPAFYLYFIPSFIPFIIHTLYEVDRIHTSMAAWGVAYFITLLTFAKISHRVQIDGIRLRIENQSLVDELQEKREVAEQANIAKSKFLAAASHDLRQPLYAMGLFTEKLHHASSMDEVDETASLIRRSFNSLKDLLDSLLDISKLDAGVITVDNKNFPLQDIFDTILLDNEPKAINKGLELHVVKSSAHLYTDPLLLERIIRNLVVNAIRYTDQGKILLGVRRRGDNYEIQVHDSGIGIPDAEQVDIFQEFYQIDNPERDRGKGLGLGLSIVQRLTQMLGSTLELDSQQGEGSLFRLTIPAGCEEAPDEVAIQDEPAPQQEVHNSNLIILVIDDDKLILHATRAFLKMHGYRVITAESREDALALFETGEPVPNLIISDYRLRDNCNGVDAAAAVIKRLNIKIPVVIVTGDTDPERIREASSHGYHLLHKPILPEELHQTIARTMAMAPA